MIAEDDIHLVTWMGRSACEGRAGAQLTEQTYLQAPRFPSDKAYVTASPAARDAHAASILAGKQAQLAAAGNAIGRRLGL